MSDANQKIQEAKRQKRRSKKKVNNRELALALRERKSHVEENKKSYRRQGKHKQDWTSDPDAWDEWEGD